MSNLIELQLFQGDGIVTVEPWKRALIFTIANQPTYQKQWARSQQAVKKNNKEACIVIDFRYVAPISIFVTVDL